MWEYKHAVRLQSINRAFSARYSDQNGVDKTNDVTLSDQILMTSLIAAQVPRTSRISGTGTHNVDEFVAFGKALRPRHVARNGVQEGAGVRPHIGWE